MKHLRIATVMVISLVLAVSGFAQRSRLGARDGSGPLIDPSAVVVVEGTVVQLVAGLGQGMPELVVEDASGTLHTFILGPFWYLDEQGFVAAEGDSVTVTAYSCTTCETGVAVVEVVNTTQGITLTLRDEDGIPLWSQRQARDGNGAGHGDGGNGTGEGNGDCDGSGGNGNSGDGQGGGTPDNAGGNGGNGGQGGNGDGGNGNGDGQGGNGNNGGQGGNGNGGNGAGIHNGLVPDLTQMTTLSGTVVTYSLQTGGGPATVTLATDSGEISIVLSPAWVLIAAGFEPEVGDVLEITAAPATVDGVEVWIALTITDGASGLTIVLRDPATGLPVGGSRRGRG